MITRKKINQQIIDCSQDNYFSRPAFSGPISPSLATYSFYLLSVYFHALVRKGVETFSVAFYMAYNFFYELYDLLNTSLLSCLLVSNWVNSLVLIKHNICDNHKIVAMTILANCSKFFTQERFLISKLWLGWTKYHKKMWLFFVLPISMSAMTWVCR